MKMRIERIVAALAGGLFCGAAGAQTIQLKPAVHVQVERDNNVFRVQDNPPAGAIPRVADTLTTVGAGAKLTLAESLQSLELRGDYGHTDYARLDDLDYDRYQLGAGATFDGPAVFEEHESTFVVGCDATVHVDAALNLIAELN